MTYGSLDDLLVDIAAGDRAAFHELYQRTSAKLYGVILRILIEPSRAEDAMQDVYTRVWRNAGSFDALRGRPITWLAAIARNIAIDMRRAEISRGSESRTDIDIEALNIVAIEGIAAEDRLVLAQCLGELDPELRNCIVAAYCEGFSREELGARFDRPVGTIKSWLHRGLAALKGCIDG